MPVRVTDLINAKRDLTVSLDDLGEVRIVYRPNAMNPRTRAELAKYDLSEQSVEYMTLWLERNLISWDLLDADGGPLSFAEGADTLPDKYLTRIVEAIRDDAVPNDASAPPPSST